MNTDPHIKSPITRLHEEFELNCFDCSYNVYRAHLKRYMKFINWEYIFFGAGGSKITWSSDLNTTT